ncbi:MAG: hypothetical protein E7021_04360 [Alphaproteobacteria bacterium]|nr:hypothetical protein [Alphaproteobacteria bacterium]
MQNLRKTNETGRSMVEMLGVLAIIGVLSVMGIAGFSRAMDKNRANTIIHEAQKRATLVVPQIQLMGDENPTITEFINNDLGYGEFDAKVYTNKSDNLPAGQFGIKVSGVSKGICQNILNTIGDNTVIRRLSTTEAPTTPITTCGETNTFLMVYNNDMGTNAVAGEFSDKSSCTNAGFIYNNGQCASDMCDTCFTGQSCLTVAGEKKCVSACPSGKERDEDTGKCEDDKCTDYTNCENNQYCEFDCGNSKPDSGTCKDISKQTETTGKYIASSGGLSWWSAVDFCEANGMHLITASDLGCPDDQEGICCIEGFPSHYWENNQFNCPSENQIISYTYSTFNPSNNFWTKSIPLWMTNRIFTIQPWSALGTAALNDWACKNYYALCIE